MNIRQPPLWKLYLLCCRNNREVFLHLLCFLWGHKLLSTSQQIPSLATFLKERILKCRIQPLQVSAVMLSHATSMAGRRLICVCGWWVYTFHLNGVQEWAFVGDKPSHDDIRMMETDIVPNYCVFCDPPFSHISLHERKSRFIICSNQERYIKMSDGNVS